MQKINICNTDILYLKDNSIPVGIFKMIFRYSGTISQKKAGVAKLFAKLLSEGTKKDGLNFYKDLEVKAIDFSFQAGFETFVIEINSLKEHFNYALNKLNELINDINFSAKALEFIKNKTISQIKSLELEFDYVAKNGLNKLLYPNTFFSYPLGSKSDINQVTISDLKEFLNSLGDFFIAVGGDVNLDEELLTKLISNFKNVKKDKIFLKASKDQKEEFIKKDTTQAYIYFGAPFDVSKDEIYKANFSSFILGSSGFGSRIMQAIRVKEGLAYSAYVRNDFSLCKKYIYGYLQTQNMQRAIELIKSEFLKFVKKGVIKQEFENSKNFIINSSPLLKETMFNRFQIFIDLYYNGFNFDEFDKRLEKIKKLSIGELNSFIKKHTEILSLSFYVVYNEH